MNVGTLAAAAVAIAAAATWRRSAVAAQQRRAVADAHAVFFLTGCASGIGKHLATVLLAKGKRVVATDINLAQLERLAASPAWQPHAARLLIRKLDVRSLADWRAVFDEAAARFGAVDVLLNIAGYLLPGDVARQPEAEVHKHMDINVKGVIFGAQTAAAHMVTRGRGHIVNFGSLAAVSCVVGLGLYSASKHATRAFSRVLAKELAPAGVAVTVICPDAVLTPMVDLQIDYPEAALTFSGSRILTVEDIERTVLDHILPNRPLEHGLPTERYVLAWVSELLPDTLTASVEGAVRQRGLRRMQQMAAPAERADIKARL